MYADGQAELVKEKENTIWRQLTMNLSRVKRYVITYSKHFNFRRKKKKRKLHNLQK